MIPAILYLLGFIQNKWNQVFPAIEYKEYIRFDYVQLFVAMDCCICC